MGRLLTSFISVKYSWASYTLFLPLNQVAHHTGNMVSKSIEQAISYDNEHNTINNLILNSMSVSYTHLDVYKRQLLLSPTRTYAPLMKQLLDAHFDQIHGVIHCSGGGQTKCMKYLPKPLYLSLIHI